MHKTSNEAYKNEGPYIHQEEVSMDGEQHKNEEGTNTGEISHLGVFHSEDKAQGCQYKWWT